VKNAMWLLLGLWLTPSPASSAPWPGETWQEAENLTALDDNFTNNLSGAHWNPKTQTLWVCVNGPGKFLALVQDDEDPARKYKIDTRDGLRGEWTPAGNPDLESITQVDYAEDAVYVIDERTDRILKYDTTVYGTAPLLTSWNIRPFVPTSGSAGSEGLAFVPDAWLSARGFVDPAGAPYLSKNGMGGLMFVAHQRGGHLYVFDLNPDDAAGVTFVGSYATNSHESSGLEFDRSTGKLYAWHNVSGNTIEELDLVSTLRADGVRQLNSLRVWDGPKGGNLEGIAMTPAAAYQHQICITDDDNQDGAGLMCFKHFAPDRASVDRQVAASSDDAEQGRKAVVVLTGSSLELVDKGVYQKIGLRFVNIPVPPKAHIVSAHIQFTTADETPATLLIRGQAIADAPTFTTALKNVTARRKTRAKVAWAPPSWAVAGTADADQRTSDLSSVVREIVHRAGWKAGNAMVFIITGRGARSAASYDTNPDDAALAPRLIIEYEPKVD
jgi:hypothetical protein